MYARSDPRSALSLRSDTAPTAFGDAQFATFADHPPQEVSGDSRTWLARGQNLVVAYTDGRSGLVLDRVEQVDEYVVLLSEARHRIEVSAGGESKTVTGPAVVFVPPGQSRVTLETDAVVVRLVTTRNEDMAARAVNADAYVAPDPNVAPFEPWPTPPDGFRIRAYGLDVPRSEGRFGRIFRCTTVMLNVIYPSKPRDTTRLSPHSHADFEQYSLCLEGCYTHYLRWPWISDLSHWRPDVTETCGAPSVAVMPAAVIHTSQSLEDTNRLVDIFSPPRADFSDRPGWVLNADDYPAP